MLAGSAEREPDAPGEPVGTGAEAIVPAAPGVEFTDQIEQPRGSGIEMHGQFCDLVAEPLEFDVVGMSRDKARTIDIHRRISLRRLYIVIFDGSGRPQDGRSRADPDFSGGGYSRALCCLDASLSGRSRSIAPRRRARTSELVKCRK